MKYTEPPALTPPEIKTILDSGDFDKLIGVRENEHLEAKSSSPYALDSETSTSAHASLATDVLSFVNNKEAFILCGLTTHHPLGTPRDVIESLALCKEQEFYQKYKKIEGIVRALIFPKPTIHVKWYPYKSYPIHGLGVIHIPPHPDENKLYVAQIAEFDGKIVKKAFVAFVIRVDDQPRWLNADEIHAHTKSKPRKLQDLQDSLTAQIKEVLHEVRLGSRPGTVMSSTEYLKNRMKEVKDGK